MLIIDAHEDLAWSMLSWGRDYTRSAAETRRREAGTPIPLSNEDTLLGYPEYRRGRVAAVLATLFVTPARFQDGVWDKLVYYDSRHANQLYNQQIDLYERLTDEHPNDFRLIKTRPEFDDLIDAWEKAPAWPPPAPDEPAEAAPSVRRSSDGRSAASQPGPDEAPRLPDGPPVGLIITMEGAEALRAVGELEVWYQRGVRSIGPAWSGTRFCGGSREPGPLTSEGYELLEHMAPLNLALDLSHMDEQAVLQALDVYPGQILASHSNALALLRGASGNRHLSDRVIQGILERNGLIGINFYNAFLKAGWRKGDRRDEVSLERVVAQIDYICQMAGDARHVGIGTDFDGGFGWQSVPHEIDTVADLQKLVPLLSQRGYTQDDIAAVLANNWLGMLRRILPVSL